MGEFYHPCYGASLWMNFSQGTQKWLLCSRICRWCCYVNIWEIP